MIEENYDEQDYACSACGRTVEYDADCSRGCDPLMNYLLNCPTLIALTEEEKDILSSISLTAVIQLIRPEYTVRRKQLEEILEKNRITGQSKFQ